MPRVEALALGTPAAVHAPRTLRDCPMPRFDLDTTGSSPVATGMAVDGCGSIGGGF